MEKRLYRSRTNRMLSGVCAGLGDYMGIDPTWVRIAWAVLTLFTGAGFIPGLLLYVIAAVIVPEAPGV